MKFLSISLLFELCSESFQAEHEEKSYYFISLQGFFVEISSFYTPAAY